MRILHQAGNSRGIVEDVPIPSPGRGEVLVKTRVSAVCGSEMHAWRGEGRPSGNLGHEAAGIVVALGEGAGARVKTGDRVGVSAIVGWGEADENFRAGRYTWCDRFTFHCDMHAEYFTIPEHGCHVLPDDIPWDAGVLISGDGLGVPYHTSTKLRSVPGEPGSQVVAVFGLGPIGLGNVLMQAHLGRTVIGVDRAPARLELARRLGAAQVIDSGVVDAPAEIRKLTGGHGAAVAIEAAGVPATVRLCFASVGKGGTVVFNGEQPALPLSPSDDFIRRDITAIGSWFYHFCEYPEMLRLAREGLDVRSLITHRYALEDAEAAYRVMQEGVSGKVLLTYPE